MGAGPQRNFGLDVLRCLAISIVLANHAFLGFFIIVGGMPWRDVPSFFSIISLISIEWLFVLSGFLIGTMMIRSFEKERSWWARARSFWLRRWFRTIPNYYLFLVVNIAIGAFALSGPIPLGQFTWKHAVFAQNLIGPEEIPFFFNEAWSLALDEWFYLALPLLVGAGALVLRTRPRDAFLFATGTLIAVPTAIRLFAPLPSAPHEWDLVFRRVTVYHLDATGWGVLAAIMSRWHPGYWRRRAGAKALAGFLLMAVGIGSVQEMYFGGFFPDTLGWRVFTAWPRFPVAFGLTAMTVGTFLAFPWIAALPNPGGRLQAGVQTVSNYTYSIYLSHFPILYLLAEQLTETAGTVATWRLWAQTAAWLALTLAVSAAVYHVFEKPVSDLRDRYTRKVDANPFEAPAPPMN